ncbi:hypothetical protein V1515DRAFT_580246 [Lipomyces mesembrius]
MSKTTFCLSDSPQYTVHLVSLQAYSRDECQQVTADSALSVVEATAVAILLHCSYQPKIRRETIYMGVRSSECMHIMEEGEDDEDWSDEERRTTVATMTMINSEMPEEPVQHRRLQALLSVTSAGHEWVHIALSLTSTIKMSLGQFRFSHVNALRRSSGLMKLCSCRLGFHHPLAGSRQKLYRTVVGMEKSGCCDVNK